MASVCLQLNNVHFIYFIFMKKHFYVALLCNTVLSMTWWVMNDIIIIIIESVDSISRVERDSP